MARFGFGEKTGVDIFEEARAILPSNGWKMAVHNQPFYAGDLISVGIGQGYWTATPLQLAFATTTLANKGIVRPPHFVDQQLVRQKEADRSITTALVMTQDPDHPPIVLKSQDNWQIVLDGMHQTVKSGTARNVFRGTDYDSAGKSGTAQRINVAADVEYDKKAISKRNLPNAMYIGYAPFDNPEIVIAVTIENGEHGGSVAGPVAKAIMDRYFENKRRVEKLDVAKAIALKSH